MAGAIDTEAVLAVIGVVLVVVGTVPAAVAAQGGGSSVLLDQGTTQVAQVTIDGTAYTVYRKQNLLPYASGLEVYADGQRVRSDGEIRAVASALAARRVLDDANVEDPGIDATSVTSESAAREQFRVVSWKIAAGELDTADLETIREVRGTAAEIDRLVSPPLAAIDAVLGVTNRMKNTGIFGVTVWDVATTAYPNLPEYERTLERVRSELREWNRAAEDTVRNLDATVRSIERVRAGEQVDYQAVAEQFSAAGDSLGRLQSKSSEVSTSLSSAGDASNEVARSLRDSRVPGRYVDPFAVVGDRLNSAANRIQSFESALGQSEQNLDAVRTTASDTHEQLLSQWTSERRSITDSVGTRNAAEGRVHGTLGAGGVSVVGGIALLARRAFLV